MEPLIRADGISMRYRGGALVGPLDVRLMAGQTLALAGPNGSGKSTVLRMLASLEPRARGHIESPLGGRRRRRALVGYSPDEMEAHDGLSVEQVVFFWCHQWVRRRAEARSLTAAALADLGLTARAAEPLASQSFGNRRRVALCVGLAHRPLLGLLDEPTAGLDAQGVDSLVALLSRRRHDGAATVVASNDPRFIERVADTVLALDRGRALDPSAAREYVARLVAQRVVTVEVARAAVPPQLPGVTWGGTSGHRWSCRLDSEVELGSLTQAVEESAGVVTLSVDRGDAAAALARASA